MSLLNRLNNVKKAQGIASTVIARQTTASGVQAAIITAPVKEDSLPEIFNEMFPYIIDFWEYTNDEVKVISENALSDPNLNQLIKMWMIECVVYEIPISRKLRALCYSEFQQQAQLIRESQPSVSLPSPARLIAMGLTMQSEEKNTNKHQNVRKNRI